VSWRRTSQDIHPEMRDERGAVLTDAAYDPDFGSLVVHLIGFTELEKFPLLRGIDPYGNTVFNQRQLPTVIRELREIAPLVPRDLRDGLLDLATYIEGFVGRPHIYLWFIGD
jgi:hypothetical protein